jgi:hypothetical protein
MKFSDGNVEVMHAVSDDQGQGRRYRSTLKFTSISTEYVGRYHCVFNHSVIDGSSDASKMTSNTTSIYIFVNGEVERTFFSHFPNMFASIRREQLLRPRPQQQCGVWKSFGAFCHSMQTNIAEHQS